ncbi:MAG: hypothetical protein IH957_12255 [Chloroflexi bacterium]|nr:hypothetical protein [Chloroflexota bacterium]
MTSARRPLPTDIVALVSFDGKVHPNEAKPLDRLGTRNRTHALEEALEQWLSFATGKHTWLNVKGATIHGLVTARPRRKRSAWEVEILIDADDDKSVVLSLFNRMLSGVLRAGAERVFLRVNADSALIDSARSVGFFAYQNETLYRLSRPPDVEPSVISLRPRTKKDLLGVFQLYGRIAPANVRAIEGPTLREWQAAQEKWGKRTKDFILEDDGVIISHVRTAGGSTGRVTVSAEGGRDTIDDLVRFALSRLKRSANVLCLASEHDGGVGRALLDAGFETDSRYTVLAKRLTKPIAELAKETDKEAVPVS